MYLGRFGALGVEHLFPDEPQEPSAGREIVREASGKYRTSVRERGGDRPRARLSGGLRRGVGLRKKHEKDS